MAKAASSSPESPAITIGIAQPTPLTEYFSVDLPTMVEVTSLTQPTPPDSQAPSSPPHPGGAESLSRPDTTLAGKGGTKQASDAALNLADRDDQIALTKELPSRIDRSQVQRLNTAKTRASLDDRRATLEPMELTFLASGTGGRLERRPIANSDPSRGAHAITFPGVLGGHPGAQPLPAGDGEQPRDPGNARAGGEVASPGTGVLHSVDGADHRISADVTFGRPLVTEGRPAVPANVMAKPKDNTESDQEVASTVQSLLHASTAGGIAGTGPGGEKGGEQTGSGGQLGPGSKAKTMGQSEAGAVDLDGSDPRLSDYVRRMRGKIHPLWTNAFPKWAALEGRQGRAIISMTILADGSVTGVSITRPSGVTEFDENVRQAVLRAAPFGPLPLELRARSMRCAISFDAMNPAVR